MLRFALLVALLFTGCQSARSGNIQHVVLLKLKNADYRDDLIDACRQLAEIESVRSLFAGTPVEMERPEVDGNYDVALIVEFTTEADYLDYVDHPKHLAMVGEWQPRLAGIRVFDFR